MEAIIQFFASIGDAFVTVFKLIFSFIGDILYIVKLTAKVLTSIPSYFLWLPDILLDIILILFSIVVIYKILGREG